MIENFWQLFCKKENLNLPIPKAWMFGDETKAMGDELGALVVAGKKTATCSAHRLYELDHDPLPVSGSYDIILNGSREPIAVTRVKKIEIIKMSEVSEAFAKKEGEGDLSYRYWYDAHLDFFTQSFKAYDLVFTPEELLVCEEFEVLFTN